MRPREAKTPAIGHLGRWGFALCLAGPITPTLAHAAGPAQDATPAIVGVRGGGDAGHGRLVIELDRAIVAAPSLSTESGGREALVFHGGVGDLPREGAGFGPIRRWYLATAGGDQTRLIVSLARAARIVRRFALPPAQEGGLWRYVVDVETGAPGPLAVQPAEIATTSPSARSEPPSQRRANRRAAAAAGQAADHATVVVIDPGHGGFNSGARGVGVAEKDVNLAEALALREVLNRGGRYRVVLTRDNDVFVPLDERVRIARSAGADLFISLHSNSAGGDPGPHGASVYTLSDHGISRVKEVIGPGEWAETRAEPGVGPILLDLTQRDTLNRSAAFASLLVERIGRRVDLLPRTQRDAGYYVLLAPDVPAVLLEMGFITSPLDQARLTDPASRARLAEAIAGAVDVYFASAAPRRADPSGSWQVSSATRPP